MSASLEAVRNNAMLSRARRHVVRRPSLLLVALLPLLVVVPYVGPSLNPNLTGDEGGYLNLAHNLLHGHYLTGRNSEVTGGPEYPNLWFGPGFPLLLAPFVALHLPVGVIRLLGPLLVFAAVVVFHRLLQLYVAPRAALLGALAFGLYVPFYTVLEHLYSETLALFLIVTMLYGTSRYLDRGQRRHLLLAGLAFGWLALTRVAFGWVLSAVLVLSVLWWAARRGDAPRRFTAICCLALVVCIPWLAYTGSVTGRAFYWGSSGPLSLYWMSAPYPGERGDWQQARIVFIDKRFAPNRPLFRSLVGRPLVEQNDALLHAARTNIRSRPGRYLKNIAANLSRMFFDFPYSFRAERLAPLLFVIPNAFVLAGLLAALGLVVGRARGLLPVEAIPFGLFAVATFVLHALLAAYPRMLFPIIPVIFWLVVVVFTRRLRVVSPADAQGRK
jgi:4-amino-4-deoxy-L-arabinose transferase-like glycosyltransferase